MEGDKAHYRVRAEYIGGRQRGRNRAGNQGADSGQSGRGDSQKQNHRKTSKAFWPAARKSGAVLQNVC